MGNFIMVYDTETNGLPVSQFARYDQVDNWPRIIQLSWAIYKEDGTRVRGRTDMIKPDGWTVPNLPFFRDNDLSTERCEREGIPIDLALDRFSDALKTSKILVAHNASFDRNVLFAELLRLRRPIPKDHEEYCTKRASEPILKLPGWRGKYKWPTLMEAHQYFFGEGFDGAHDAGADVDACAKVYFAIQTHLEMQDLFGE